VKGVVRRAAEELASGLWEMDRGWKGLDQPAFTLITGSDKKQRQIALSAIDALFGREPPSGDADAVRGALSFWDVIPQIKGDSLMVEIMTPHQSHYYQEKQERKSGDSITPHDSGQPNPIAFLTVPPGSHFTFCVTCDMAHLNRLAPHLAQADPASGKPRWQLLIEAAFEHAFQWLGFGAKTAVGYGAMETAAMRQARLEEQKRRDEAVRAEQEAQSTVAWPGSRLKFNRANKALTAEKDGKTAIALAPQGEALLASLPPEVRKKVETNQFVKVTAYVSGSSLVKVEAS
ncbi:MAG: type III-B CRISPR module RAMP protein Cmr6, partial [Candidatus Thermofonsia Clade 3 bacterium]